MDQDDVFAEQEEGRWRLMREKGVPQQEIDRGGAGLICIYICWNYGAHIENLLYLVHWIIKCPTVCI